MMQAMDDGRGNKNVVSEEMETDCPCRNLGSTAASRGEGDVSMLMDEETSTSRVLDGMQGAGHVHYAEHGAPGTLLLAQTQELTRTQVQLSGAPTILSSDDSSMGQVRRPEGNAKMARAFLLMVVGSGVESLWGDTKVTRCILPSSLKLVRMGIEERIMGRTYNLSDDTTDKI